MKALTSRRLAQLTGLSHGFVPEVASGPDPPVWRPIQVHGGRIARPSGPNAPPQRADGAAAGPGGPAVGVISADCVPLLLGSPAGVVAAVHAGWRPLAEGIVEGAVAELEASGAPASTLAAALGPAAGGCCYQVGAEVPRALGAGRHARPDGSGRFLLDLRAVVVERLVAAGLHPERIDVVGPCTICSPHWPSWRRQGPSAGRALAWIHAPER